MNGCLIKKIDSSFNLPQTSFVTTDNSGYTYTLLILFTTA